MAGKPWFLQWWGIIFLFLLAAVLSIGIAFAFYVNDIRKDLEKGVVSRDFYEFSEVRSLVEGENNYYLGSNRPLLTIVEFGDFSCPLCKESFPIIREIAAQNPDKIKFIFRDYPAISEFSSTLAMAARCAGEQGLFWPMYDKLFLTPGLNSKDKLKMALIQIGGDPDRFSQCLDAEKYWEDIRNDVLDGDRLQISGTPTWFLNGSKISGHIPREAFWELINKYLE